MRIVVCRKKLVFAWCLLGLFSTGLSAQAAPRKLALLVGISHYERGRSDDKDWWNLNCHTDIVTMQRVLETRFGFAPKDIVVLEDSKATKKGILDAFQHQLVDRARPGDIVVFHYSGHGQQVPDKTKRKMNGMHQAMIPFDYIDQSAQSGVKADVLDDDIRDSLRRLKTKMRGSDGKVQGNITVFLDSCFSGSATRGAKKGLPKRGRGWNENIDGPKPRMQTRGALSGDNSMLEKGEALAQGYVVITATRSDEVANEAENDQKKPMGAFTFFLTKALSGATPLTTYRALFEKVSAQVQNTQDNQNPQLEGDSNKLLFSGAALPASNYLVVQKTEGAVLTLPTGSVQGATKGSTYEIFRAGSDVNNAKNKIAEATISQVDGFTSQAKLNIEYSKLKPADLLAARAVETAHFYGDDQLKVFLVGKGNWFDTILAAQKNGELNVMTTQGVTAENCDVRVFQDDAQIKVMRRLGKEPLAIINDGAKAASRVRDVLVGESRWRFLNRLEDSAASKSLLQVEVQMLPVKSADDPTARTNLTPTEGGHFIFKDGDAYMLKLRNLSPVDAYVSVLDLSPDGTINAILPPADMAVGELNRIPADDKWHVVKGFIWTASAPFGRETWKAIATRDQANFNTLLLQKPATADGQILYPPLPDLKTIVKTRGGPPNPMESLMLTSKTGRRGSNLAPPKAWTTSQVTFEVVAK